MVIDGVYKCSIICEVPEHGLVLRHNGEMKLYQDEGQLKGSMFPTFFWLNSPFRCGSVDGNRISFTVHFATPCQQFSMDIKAEISETGEVNGTCTNPMGIYKLVGQRA